MSTPAPAGPASPPRAAGGAADPTILEHMVMLADELGLRLEVVEGLGVWEAHPAAIHQRAVFRIQVGIRPIAGSDRGCACAHLADVLVRFPDGSLKRPDISVFCREPDEEDQAITLLPEAVVEILSRGYEKKDTVMGAPFYLAQGVRDVVLFDPYALKVTHLRSEGTTEHASPVTLRLACGCEVTV